MPQARASCSPPARDSRLRRANESVTAVEETKPPVSPVRAAPRPVPSQRVAAYPSERERGDEHDQQPERVGVERVPGVDRAPRQQREHDEGGDEQPQPGVELVAVDAADQPVQRLLVGQQRRRHDPERGGQARVVEDGHRPQQANGHGRRLRRDADVPGTHPRQAQVAGDEHSRDQGERGHEDPRAAQLPGEPRGDGAEQGDEREGADAAGAEVPLAGLVLLALDPDEGADEQCGREIADEHLVDDLFHAACPPVCAARLRRVFHGHRRLTTPARAEGRARAVDRARPRAG